jgi:hypothetical protein
MCGDVNLYINDMDDHSAAEIEVRSLQSVAILKCMRQVAVCTQSATQSDLRYKDK